MTQSVVEFPGNFRIHAALNVADVKASKKFYELLFGEPLTKARPRYAKFEPTDPSVNLSLNEVDTSVSGSHGSAHFGVQVKTVAAVHEALERFKAPGIETITEEATTCCYAVQDKVWAVDPDDHKWEVFVVLEADAKDKLYEQSRCCSPNVVQLGIGKTCDAPK